MAKLQKLRIIPVTLVVMLALALISGYGCTGQNTTPEQQQGEGDQVPVSFTVLDVSAAPQGLKDLASQKRDKATATGIELEGNVYLLITRGVKPTGGYKVEIVSVSQETSAGGTVIAATVEYSDPEPSQMVTQVITYPMTAAKLNLKAIPAGISFVFHRQTR